MKKIVSVILSAVLVLSLAACSKAAAPAATTQAAAPAATQAAAPAATTQATTPAATQAPAKDAIVLKIGHMRPEGSFLDKNVKEFCQKVTENTNGRYTFEIYPANQLGDYEVVYERVGLGEIDMFLGSMTKSVDSSLQITSVPGLLTSWDLVKKYLNTTDGKIAQYAKERLLLQNVHVLANHPMYFGVIALTKEPVNWDKPGESQGLMVRVPSINKGLTMFGEKIGYTVAGLPSSEDFTNMQTGVTDGTIGGGAERTWNDLKDVTKYIIPCNTHFETQWLSINEDLWQKLSAEDQAIFEKAAKEMEAYAFEVGPNNTDVYLEQFRELGVKVYDMTGVQEKYDAIIRDQILPAMRENLGDAIPVYDEVLAEISAS